MQTDEVSNSLNMMNTKKVIQQRLEEYYPADGKVFLFGSRARGEATKDSDWDILMLINKPGHVTDADYNKYAYPLVELGLSINQQIHPLLYTFKDWEKRSFTPFYENVTKESVALCH